jgi:putative transposase
MDIEQTSTINSPAHGRDLRKGRVSIENNIYLVTIVTQGGRPLFNRLECGRVVVCSLQYAEKFGIASTLAYVVMPDHSHWLMSLENQSSLSNVVGRIKRNTSRQINRHLGYTGVGVWQRGFHEHALRGEEDVRDVARYIVANPLRAGLVKRVGDYPLWDAVWL